ncbi:hypothetical protein GZH47_33510 (plasmid) [Paenibacillus rhizovicinus]|uniref:Uncharacterized protein n=1 Tax=Paenibacillus rhizovicinus TaxID=2704463 RepID=A0A6C0PCZ4_9BACL|nr:hypothetical protein [Paenibacillus rhizovicinus]QHW35812.1 hypothetical protein GZH47_33510 [Paenibacillus rhizovicinus]
MGYMTTITILNDAFDQIEKHPVEFVESIKLGMNGIDKFGARNKEISNFGIGNYANPIDVARAHHADDPRLYLAFQNMTVAFGYSNDLKDPRHLELRKRMLKMAKDILKQEERLIKELEGR